MGACREETSMGFLWVERVLTDSQSRGSARFVLVVLAQRANAEGVCWPALADIATRVALSEKQTRRCVRDLEALGELRIIKRGGGRTPNHYQVMPRKILAPTQGVSTENTRTPMSGTPDTHGRGPRTPMSGVCSENTVPPLSPLPSHPRECTPPVHGRRTVREESEKSQQSAREAALPFASTALAVEVGERTIEKRKIGERKIGQGKIQDMQLAQAALNKGRRAASFGARPVGDLAGQILQEVIIPRDEQAKTFELLRGAGIGAADAVDLSRLAPYDRFKEAVQRMKARKNVRNPGGWLRRLVSAQSPDKGNRS